MTMCPRRKSIEEEKRMCLEWHCPLVVPDTSEGEARSLVDQPELTQRTQKKARQIHWRGATVFFLWFTTSQTF